MSAFVDKTQDQKHSVSASVDHQVGATATFGDSFVDHRAETQQARALQQAANQSTQVSQLKSYHALMNQRSVSNEVFHPQSISASTAMPLQRKGLDESTLQGKFEDTHKDTVVDLDGDSIQNLKENIQTPPITAQLQTNPIQMKPAAGMNDHFRMKHRAKDKKQAQAAADYYGGTVTVIKNKPGVDALVAKSEVKGSKFEIPNVNAWKFVNSKPKDDESGTAKGALDEEKKLLHMDGIF